jgi:hypothetical protein
LISLLIWLDMEVIAKLFDEENNEKNDTENLYNQARRGYSIMKTMIEDIPLIIMQSLFLNADTCREGLNTIVILSLYFNGICILYTFANIFN